MQCPDQFVSRQELVRTAYLALPEGQKRVKDILKNDESQHQFKVGDGGVVYVHGRNEAVDLGRGLFKSAWQLHQAKLSKYFERYADQSQIDCSHK